MPPPVKDQKEDYKCPSRVIETALGNKCVETIKNIKEAYLNTAFGVYTTELKKTENEVQMRLHVEIVIRPSHAGHFIR